MFNVLAIQKEIAFNIEPFLRQRVLLHQFFQQQAGALQNLAKQMNYAVETYRHAFEVFGNLQEQIQRAQKERERIVLSVSQIVDSWNRFVPNIPTEVIATRPIRPQTREVVLHQDDLVETITNRVLEKVEERAKERAQKLLSGTAIVTLPSGTRWEDITFAFTSDIEVEIRCGKKFIGRFDREVLRFVKTNTKDKTPNKAWTLLLLLSAFKLGKGEQPTVNNLLGNEHFKQKDALHATKSILSKHLRQVFGIDEEPFFNYSEYGYYHSRFILIPPVGLRGSGETFITRKKKGFKEDPQPNEDSY
ncbi:MAG: hypothetical protein Q7S04_02900 [Candidatus Moranbacteria bacterium]|nr:hypothetical protein [Candidatus Moranbacteria bacterium]